jgi:hypothetical protein
VAVLLLLLPWQLPSDVISTARKYLYVRETYYHGQPINRSPDIDRWTRKVGLSVPKNPHAPGYYWCMIYVWNMFEEAVHPNPLMRTASVSEQLRYANKIGSGLTVIKMSQIGTGDLLRRGDIFCIKEGIFSDQDIGHLWPGHTGLTEEESGGYAKTIEGNTNKSGSRNGDRVAEKTRDINSFIAIIRIGL